MWFAVEKGPVLTKGVGQPGGVRVFHIFDDDIMSGTNSRSSFKGNGTRVFRPKHITKTIVARGGWFTVHTYLASGHRFIPLDRNNTYARAGACGTTSLCGKCVRPVKPGTPSPAGSNRPAPELRSQPRTPWGEAPRKAGLPHGVRHCPRRRQTAIGHVRRRAGDQRGLRQPERRAF